MSGPKLLSGGNPQIPKGAGNGPVQAYIEAMPGWKQRIGKAIDEMVERTVPAASKAVKWNTPFYGMADKEWFLAFHCFEKYVKITFFRGTSLDPLPPGKSKQQEVRCLDIREEDVIDEAVLGSWIRQASELPGVRL